jgi:glucose/arabinose dehydrogenase
MDRMYRAISRFVALLAFAGLAAVSCSNSTEPEGPGDDGNDGNGGTGGGGGTFDLAVEVVASGFSNPIHLTAPSGDSRLFVVEQGGVIRIIVNDQVLGGPFLDISGLVQSGGERGLFSMAFHPQYDTNGYFYVNYTDNGGDSRIVRYTVSGDPNVADPSSAKLILSLAQPAGNHNGGQVAFGADGMLYIGFGDGGGGGDPQGHGQNINTLLGSLLRIDVDGGDPYAVPGNNPFVGQAGADEIWAYGLRNPWRFSFDRGAGQLYVADVGQNEWEEVNAVAATQAGVNYGWNTMEATHCFNSGSCNTAGLTAPVLEYSHSEGCSVTGGYVYRGSAINEVQGHYFYSDYCSGFLRSFRYSGGSLTDDVQWDVGSLGSVLSFGEDATGELYVLSSNGTVYRIIESG